MSQYRRRCLDEKGEQCQVCGTGENVIVHHLNGDREDNRLQNLVPVCRSHHMQIHYDNDHLEAYTAKLPKENRFKVDGSSKTSIAVSEALADELFSRKGRTESYDQVIWRLIESQS